MQKWSSSPSIWLAMRLCICSQRLFTDLRRSLNLRREIRLGIEERHSFSFASNSQFSLSISSVSAAMLRAMTSESEKRGTSSGRVHFSYFQDKKILRICQIQKLCLSLHPNSERHDLNSHIGVVKFTFASLTLGEMVEWSITAVLKTAVPRGTGGSNPSLSANKGVNQRVV